MNAASQSPITKSSHIRQLNIAKDLDKVADLVEMCFPIHLDQDGQTYVNEMRKTAREMRMMSWLSNVAEFSSTKAAGFVWEEDDEIIGNLSLIPFQHAGRPLHLIANVAVHPDHRRRGIARALTSRALAHLQQQRALEVWLQVRDDNPPAMDLYRSVGFVDQFTRSTWRAIPMDLQNRIASSHASGSVRRRLHRDWAKQKQWLDLTYPFEIRWNLLVDFRRFPPGFLQSLTNMLDGYFLRHWRVGSKGSCQGVITWQKTNTYANNLWLAFPENGEEEYIQPALQSICKQLSQTHPISINYPKGRAQTLFEDLGFNLLHTLIWMKTHLK
jgi:ribosomal protein S18 acetylase RimI-like enzyme